MTPSTAPSGHAGFWWRGLAWAAALALLLGIFSFYTHPDFMLDMADKLWSCF